VEVGGDFLAALDRLGTGQEPWNLNEAQDAEAGDEEFSAGRRMELL
jgi:hypothetical protein